ncbi:MULTISPECIES: flavin-containing monooxygenase [Pseudonocardia]|uniref:4-hydroxyacetophenone monooxygenase n=2 Tax=Pseudonocardia TaxID=1847 RepID=A0A1Y2MHZ0_PSEAH|nr:MULTISPECIES: NAD(P)/FAD-dependent oxidoreductase [Pseudonocardia]OSY34894.1 4-hydroxyacetophenone monooxygenase [Pseudonocardia autotrophica]TDN75416.1 4-hydroxyacetophenone monooxygenase [Pseudonocardia autotrophica]BBF99374.1 monooxygenase [Pseudonocardia autotrophica]GEC29353.1 monooxygenase [Pseudonocardia saturnea]
MPVLCTPQRPLDEARLRTAVASANLPTLAMVTFHLTGDRRWLHPPYRPVRSAGLGPNDDGGLDEAVAADLRAAAVEALTAWSRGAEPAVPDPDPDLLRTMLSTAVGEEVPDEYERLMREEMGFTPDPGPRPVRHDRDFSVVIIGAGISGIAAAVRLQRAGIPFVILERNDDVGGVWLTNTYPGAGVDTPSYLYSFSFFPRNWSTHFGKRDEMAAYLAEAADHFGLRRHIEFGVSVDSATWDDDDQHWTVTAGGRSWRAPAVISAVGLFNTPKVPNLPGLDEFEGPIFHTADWPDDIDLTGKRVAVVGTGASAMQVVPAVAGRTGHLTVFQRSPQWIAPNAEYFAPVGDDVHWLMSHVPYYHDWYRFRLAWVFNDRVHPSLQVDPDWPHPERALNAVNDGHRRFFTRYIEQQLDGRPDLIEKCLPDYPPFGKRMLLDNGWYAALRRDDVDLVTAGVARITATGVTSDTGEEYDADVVVLSTGFDAQHFLPGIDVRGRDGTALHDVWGEDDAVAHLGISVPGFPNLFLMYGPNTNAGAGGSFIFVAEAQTRYIVDLITTMTEDGIGAVEVTPEALDRWVTDVDRRHARMVWSHPGMTTYYRNSRGRVVTNSPYRVVDYWSMTRDADLADHRTTPVPARAV